MAASEAEICNLAIAICESDKFIESLDESSQEAINCKVWYAATRDLVLRKAAWPFAKKRGLLNLSGTPPSIWDYSYVLPGDCLTALGVEDGSGSSWPFSSIDTRATYAIENDGTGDGRRIYMNVRDAKLIYTMRAVNPTIYSPEFVEALSWKLASNIARPLKIGADKAREILQFAEQLMARAAAMAYNEQKPGPAPTTDLYTGRLC